MLGETEMSDIKQTGLKYPCTPHPAFFPRASWPKRVQTVCFSLNFQDMFSQEDLELIRFGGVSMAALLKIFGSLKD